MSSTPNGSRRRLGLAIVLVLVVLAGVGYGLYWQQHASHYVVTDNAYVQGHVVQITPQVAGTVTQVLVEDTQSVQAGQVLVQLDAADAQIALEQAQSALAQAVREAGVVYANNASLRAQIVLRESEIAKARVELERVTSDYERRRTLTGTGAVSDEELAHARSAIAQANTVVTTARSAVAAAREQLQANAVRTQGVDVRQHPSVMAAAARVRETLQTVRRMTLVAPVAGQVARRSVQLGQRVQAGNPLLAIVPLDQVWVEANFKEVQLRDVRLGQKVVLIADVYGEKVQYEGRISGVGAGTGAAFALLPAQNATGNWIKVVQRLPVRISLDPAQLREHPLRVGLSMHAEIDLRAPEIKPKAPPAAASTAESSAVAGQVPDQGDPQAKALIDRIIEDNLGRKR